MLRDFVFFFLSVLIDIYLYVHLSMYLMYVCICKFISKYIYKIINIIHKVQMGHFIVFFYLANSEMINMSTL